jgi:hypothetical protein
MNFKIGNPMIKFFLGGIYIHGLRNSNQLWVESFQILNKKLGISRLVKYLISTLEWKYWAGNALPYEKGNSFVRKKDVLKSWFNKFPKDGVSRVYVMK